MKHPFITLVVVTCLILSFLPAITAANSYLSQGKVVDAEDGAPLRGASILIGETPYGRDFSNAEMVVTGPDGEYRLSRSFSSSVSSSGYPQREIVMVVYQPGYVGYTWKGVGEPKPEGPPVIRLQRVSSFRNQNELLRETLNNIPHFRNDDELNPALKIKNLLKSIPDIELMTGRIEWERIVRAEEFFDKNGRFSFGKDWRNVYDKALVNRLEKFLTGGTSREKILALAMLPFPQCNKPAAYDSAYLALFTDPDPLVREMALIVMRREFANHRGANRKKSHIPLYDHLAVTSVLPPEHERQWELQPSVSCVRQDLLDAVKHAVKDAEPRVRFEAVLALGLFQQNGNREILEPLVTDSDPLVRTAVAFSMAELKNPAALSRILDFPSSGLRDFLPRSEAIRGVRKQLVWNEEISAAERETMMTHLTGLLSDPLLRREALGAFTEFPAPLAAAELKASISDPDSGIRQQALSALLRLTDNEAACTDCFDRFVKALDDPDSGVRHTAMKGIGAYTGEDVLEVVLKMLHNSDEPMRRLAIRAFRAPYPKALQAIMSQIEAEEPKKGEKLADATKPESLRSLAIRSLHYLMLQKKGTTPPKEPVLQEIATRLSRCYPTLSLEERAFALEVITLFDTEGLHFLQTQMTLGDNRLKIRALQLGSRYFPQETVPQIIANFDATYPVTVAAKEALSSALNTVSLESVAEMITHSKDDLRWFFYDELRKKTRPGISEIMLFALKDKSLPVRIIVAEYFAENKEARAVPLLSKIITEMTVSENRYIPPNISRVVPNGERLYKKAALALKFQDGVTDVMRLGLSSENMFLRDAASDYYTEKTDDNAIPLLVTTRTSATVSALKNQNANLVVAALKARLDRAEAQDKQKELETKNWIVYILGQLDNADLRIAAQISLMEEQPESLLIPALFRTFSWKGDSRLAAALQRYISGKHAHDFEAITTLGLLHSKEGVSILQQLVVTKSEALHRREKAMAAVIENVPHLAVEYLTQFIAQYKELQPEAIRLMPIRETRDRRSLAKAAGQAVDLYRSLLNLKNNDLSYLRWPNLKELLNDSDRNVVRGAVLLIRRGRDRDAIPELKMISSTADSDLKTLIDDAISALGASGEG